MPTVAQLVVEGLRQAQVSRLFGVPTRGANEAILEAARAQGLSFVRCHQESAAVMMAAVTGELTGRPGAVLSGLGPGVTASATGLAHALLDRSPLIFLSERHADTTRARSTHQALDYVAHLAPIVKASLTLTVDSASHWLAHAARLALGEPRGPVHLDLPADLAERAALPLALDVAPTRQPAPDSRVLDGAGAMIREARRPLVVAGLECRAEDAKWLRAFCEALPAPLLTTAKAKGAVPDPHPLVMGALTGGVLEQPVMKRADLIIAFGLDTVELPAQSWPYPQPVLSLGRRPSAGGVGAPFAPALEVVGDLATILEELAPRLVGSNARADWDVAEVDRLRRQRRGALELSVPGLAPHRIVQLTRELTPAGTIATADPGAFAFPVMDHWHAVEPGEYLVSSGLGTPGFALPAAIAALLAHPDRRAVGFTDDGGLLGVAAELETAARLRLPLLIVAFNGGPVAPPASGRDESGHHGQREELDLAALGRALGLVAFTASDEAGFLRALYGALGVNGPALIDARIDAAALRRTLEIVHGGTTS
jgi:acetolactate synthase-1/2/3 large subunit